MVIALSPGEAPSHDKTGQERLQEDRPQVAANEKRIQVSIGGGEQFDLPDGASDWFRAALKDAKVVEIVDPLADQVPIDPPYAFHDGKQLYLLIGDAVILTDYARTTGRKFLRSYEHDAFRRLDKQLRLIDYSDTAKAGEALSRFVQQECRDSQNAVR
jgi:hypothetical protein